MVYDLIIIGAGPAGVSAAIYAARQKLNLLILSKDIGGQVAKKAVDIENYLGFEKISGPDLAKLFKEQIQKNEVGVETEEVTQVEKPANHFLVHTKSGKQYEALSVIVASGAESRHLGIPGEDEFAGKGVSTCSLCDGPIFKNKTVAVIGGGNNGFESALFLSNYVTKIYLLEFSSQVKADAENQAQVAKHKHIEIITNAKVQKIEGKTFVTSLTYQDTVSGLQKTFQVNGVFVEIGYVPATHFVKNLVELTENNEILFDPKTLQTKTPGLFSAGDCNVGKYKQIVLAAGDGSKAALSSYEYIRRISNH